MKRTQLKKAQTIVDKYITDSRSFTAGKQRYISIKEGGMGVINLYNQMKAMSIFWVKKLIKGNSISVHIPKTILNTLGIIPSDLLTASLWELKYIAFHLRTYYSLNFWATIIERIEEFRQTLNTHINQDECDIEPTTHIQDKIQANRITQKLRRNFTPNNILNQPTIFSKHWIDTIRKFPAKIHLLGDNGNLNHELKLNESNNKIMTLTNIMTEYKQRLGSRNINQIKSDPLRETLGQQSKKSVTSRIYSAYAHMEAKTKTNFSTPEKWYKKGFCYSRQVIKQAAKVIMKLKIPGSYKATLIKHNLLGFVEPKILVKLGYKNTKECNLCHDKDITYTHIIFDCPIAQFLINQACLHFQQNTNKNLKSAYIL